MFSAVAFLGSRQARFSSRRPRRVALLASLSLILSFLYFFHSPTASADHGTRTLEVSSEISSKRTSETLTLTATISSAATVSLEIDFEVISGPSDPDGLSPETPDKSCTVATGASTCSPSPFSSSAAGTNLIVAWIDHDKNGPVVEADLAEGRYSGFYSPPAVGNDCTPNDPPDTCPVPGGEQPGAKAEPDQTDVVQVTWTASPAKLDCNPENEINPVTGAGSSETYTCTVLDVNDLPVGGVRIDGENMSTTGSGLGGANDPDDSDINSTPDYGNICTTNANGQCTGTVSPSEGQAGSADICFWADDDNDNLYDATGPNENDGSLCDTEAFNAPENDNITDKVRKTWSASAPPPVLDHIHLWKAGTESANCESGLTSNTIYIIGSDQVVACAHTSEGSGHKPISDLSLTFTENGPASPNSSAITTGANGKASLTLTSDKPGQSQVTASGSLGGPTKTSNTYTANWIGGYWMVASDGGIFSFGDAPFKGSLGGTKLNAPIVGMEGTPTGEGYWMVATDGGIFAFGDAKFFGSTGNIKLNQPIVGMASTPSGQGYWLVASDGGIFAFGDAKFFGSTGNIKLNQPIVGMASTPSGQGYWLVASDGGIFAFGDAPFKGSMGGSALNAPIVGMSATLTGSGYWLVATDGGIFSFGDASFFGSTGNIKLNQPIVEMDTSLRGQGYWFVATDGGIFAFGDAPFLGSTGDTKLNQPIVGMARSL